jgi:hypothetical protein
MSTQIQITPASGITVGTTAVTSGTVGRVFFQGTGDVVQQDGALAWDNTLKRLTLKAVGTAATDIPLAIRNSADSQTLLQVNGLGNIQGKSNGGVSFLGLHYRPFEDANGWSLTNSHSGYGQGTGIETVGSGVNILSSGTRALSIGAYSTGSFKTYGIWNWGSASGGQRLVIGENVFDPQVSLSGTGNLGIGTFTAGARLDVRAQGALSTDIAFRVRNSADSDNLFSVNGIGNLALRASSGTEPFTIHHSGTLQTKLEVASNSGLLRIYNAGVLRHDIDGRDYASFKGIKINAAGLGFNYLNIQGGTNSRVNVDIAVDPIFDIFNASNLNVLRIDSRSGEGLLQCKNTGAPTTSITDGFKQYSADIVAGNAAPHFRTENGAIVKLYQETTAVTASTLVSNLGTILTDTDTIDGYTLKQVVKALRNLGILA